MKRVASKKHANAHEFKFYLVFLLSIENKDVQSVAYMALDVVRHAQSTVEITIVTYSMELVLHADQDGQKKLVKQICFLSSDTGSCKLI